MVRPLALRDRRFAADRGARDGAAQSGVGRRNGRRIRRGDAAVRQRDSDRMAAGRRQQSLSSYARRVANVRATRNRRTPINLYVGNLPFSTTNEDLAKALLTQVGAVSSAQVINDRDTGRSRLRFRRDGRRRCSSCDRRTQWLEPRWSLDHRQRSPPASAASLTLAPHTVLPQVERRFGRFTRGRRSIMTVTTR